MADNPTYPFLNMTLSQFCVRLKMGKASSSESEMTSSMRRMGFLPERPNLLPVGTWELEETVIGRDIVPGAGVEGTAGWNLGFGTEVDGEIGMGRVGIVILIASFI